MRRVLHGIVFLSAGLFGPTELARADLRCTPRSADLGEIRGGTPRQQRFTLVNDGTASLEIVEIERGCGCLEAHVDRLLLPPGTTATLRVDLRTSGQPNGPRSWNLRVRYREGERIREELLVVGATIVNEVTVEPSILALHVRDKLRQEITVTDRRSPPLKVTALHTTSPAIAASVQSTEAGVTKLVVEVTAAVLTQDRQEAVLSIYTDDPVYNPVQLPITLMRVVKTTIATSPSQVQVYVSAAQPVAAALVRLRRADGERVVITAAEADDPGITCTWATGPGADATIKVQVDRRKLAERDGARCVRVRVADEVMTIPVRVDCGPLPLSGGR